jgi:hypothetical protein
VGRRRRKGTPFERDSRSGPASDAIHAPAFLGPENELRIKKRPERPGEASNLLPSTDFFEQVAPEATPPTPLGELTRIPVLGRVSGLFEIKSLFFIGRLKRLTQTSYRRDHFGIYGVLAPCDAWQTAQNAKARTAIILGPYAETDIESGVALRHAVTSRGIA